MGSLVFLRKVEKLVGDSAGDRGELVPLTSSLQLCHTKGVLEVGGLLCLIFGEAGEDLLWLFRYLIIEILIRKFAQVFLHAFFSKLTYLPKINYSEYST